MDQQSQLQVLSDEYQGLQTELNSLVSARQKLEGQFTENKTVQKACQQYICCKFGIAKDLAGIRDSHGRCKYLQAGRAHPLEAGNLRSEKHC